MGSIWRGLDQACFGGWRVQTKRRRPLVGHPKDQLDPLLNFQSFLSGNFEFWVRIMFEKDGEILQIMRIADPRIPEER